MMRSLAVLVLVTLTLAGCDSGAVRVPEDWRQYTGFCTTFGKPTDQRYTFWYPPEWVMEPESDPDSIFAHVANFDSTAREGDASIMVRCTDSSPADYWGVEALTADAALERMVDSITEMRGDDDLEIIGTEVLNGPLGDILKASYTDTWLGWAHSIELVTYGSPIVSLSYSAQHDVSVREQSLLLDVMRTVRFPE